LLLQVGPSLVAHPPWPSRCPCAYCPPDLLAVHGKARCDGEAGCIALCWLTLRRLA
jgi:hypothetical protein